MKIVKGITINLSPEDVKEAVKQYLANQSWDVKKVTFEVEVVTTGYGQAEHDEHRFAGATAYVKKGGEE